MAFQLGIVLDGPLGRALLQPGDGGPQQPRLQAEERLHPGGGGAVAAQLLIGEAQEGEAGERLLGVASPG